VRSSKTIIISLYDTTKAIHPESIVKGPKGSPGDFGPPLQGVLFRTDRHPLVA
jgi:hypothetical protein